MLNAEGRSALVPNLRLQIGALGLLVHVEESIALFVGGIDQFPRNSVMREGEEADVLQRITDFRNKAIPVGLIGRCRQSKVDGGNAPTHGTQSL